MLESRSQDEDQTRAAEALARSSLQFWDFDGVIKESVDAKGAAFEQLFVPFGAGLAARVRRHHERHGGVPRREKLRIYLGWAGETVSDEQVERYCGLFAAKARTAVIDAEWVPGAREYLEAHHRRQTFVLISATPQEELESIVRALAGDQWFRRIYGSPMGKAEAIERSLSDFRRERGDALVVGDSDSDREAAAKAGVRFLLRRTEFNLALQRRHTGLSCADFRPFV